MVARFYMNRFIGHMNPLLIMAAIIDLKINPNHIMGVNYNARVWEDLRKLYEATFNYKSCNQLEELFSRVQIWRDTRSHVQRRKVQFTLYKLLMASAQTSFGTCFTLIFSRKKHSSTEKQLPVSRLILLT